MLWLKMDVFTGITLTFLFLIFAIQLLWKMYVSKYSFIYCPYTNIPIFGSVLHIKNNLIERKKQFEGIYFSGKHVFMLWMGFKPLIFASTKEYARIILSSHTLLRKSFFYNFFHEWLGTGLLTSDGNKWKTRRRLLTPSFHFSILNEFVPILEKNALNLVEQFKTFAQNKEIIDIQTFISLSTLKIMCQTSMDIDIDTDQNANNYVNAIENIKVEINKRQRSPWLWPNFIYPFTSNGKNFYKNLKCIQDYTLNVINERIKIKNKIEKEINENKKVLNSNYKKSCFIDLLLNCYKNDEIDISGIREEVDTFIFEGHDTTAAAISFCLYNIGRHINHQKTLQQEIDSTDGATIIDKINKMKFLDAIIKESLRLHPPVSLIARCLEEDIFIDGKKFLKNTDIVVNILWLHHNEKYWNDPLIFNPHRFENEEFYKRDPFCYIPFSAGVRNCIGQRFALLEIKICIYYILKYFSLRSIQEEEDLLIAVELILRSKNGILIAFESR